LQHVVTPGTDGGEVFDVEAIYREYAGRCYALARQIVRDPHLAQDVVHEVFVSVVRAADKFDADRGGLLTWLMTITHHRSVDMVRRRQLRTGLDVSDFELSLIEDPTACTEDAAARSEQSAVVCNALKRLAKPEREVLVLSYFGGYSQSEIARHLHVPLGTVKSRARSGMRRLHDDIGVHTT